MRMAISAVDRSAGSHDGNARCQLPDGFRKMNQPVRASAPIFPVEKQRSAVQEMHVDSE
jgi:hypothetical protein